MIILILAGAPGSGKGTQSDLIVKKFNLTHLSTGDLLRNEVKNDTELGKIANQYISNGQLVPDELIINILKERLKELGTQCKGIILDGFPRTLTQAEALEAMMDERNTPTSIFVDVSVEEDELMKRLLLRSQNSGRSDDNEDTIKKRLQVYHNQTKPVSSYYRKLGKYVSIDGIGKIDDIFKRISQEIDKI